jgi:hypothetical protein
MGHQRKDEAGLGQLDRNHALLEYRRRYILMGKPIRSVNTVNFGWVVQVSAVPLAASNQFDRRGNV